MKFECRECRTPCKLDWGDSELYNPTECPAGLKEANWRKVAEPAALPKLTVEELERRGIEWPENAVCVTVNGDGSAHFCDGSMPLPSHNPYTPIPGKWDVSGFTCLTIFRPEKTTSSAEHEDFPAGETCQPDWLKIGEWAAVGNFVGKVDWISRDGSECRITCGESRFAKRDEVKAVTWRAWNDDEMKRQMGKVVKSKSHGHHLLVVECGFSDDGAYLFAGFQADGRDANEMLEYYEQLNGLPCGVPQVEGKDLEG